MKAIVETYHVHVVKKTLAIGIPIKVVNISPLLVNGFVGWLTNNSNHQVDLLCLQEIQLFPGTSNAEE